MKLNNFIDHTNLNIRATEDDVRALCSEAVEYSFPAVCVSPNHVPFAVEALKAHGPKVCTVIGFPNGYSQTESKIFELKHLMSLGATELDVVLNLQDVAEGKWNKIQDELKQLRIEAKNFVVKLIIESSLLKNNEIRIISKLCCEEKIDYVKTSTGFNGKASLHAVHLIKETVGNKALIKASGGIKTKEDAIAYIKAGASRIGTSSGVSLVS